MPITVFHSDDEVQNLLWALSVLRSAIEGIGAIAEDSIVDPEEQVAPIRLFINGIQETAERIQELTGGVLIGPDRCGAVLPMKVRPPRSKPVRSTDATPGVSPSSRPIAVSTTLKPKGRAKASVKRAA